MLSTNDPSSEVQNFSFNAALLLLLLSGILTSLAMRSSKTFSRKTVIIGLIAHISGLFYFLFLLLYPSLAFIPMFISAPFIVVWYFMISLKLAKISIGKE